MNHATPTPATRYLAPLDEALTSMRILVVDDEAAQGVVLRSILRRAGFQNLHIFQDPRAALAEFHALQPDLVLLDLNMPYLSGFQVLERLRGAIDPEGFLPIMMLTADVRPSVKQNALANGIHDFLTKPFDSAEVVLRVRNLLETRRYHQALKQHNAELEAQVAERTQQLELAQLELLVRLARAAEYRDDSSGEHVWRVAHLAGQLARELGLEPSFCKLITRAARLHDVGKITIPDSILRKPTPLTAEEFEVIKTHTTKGAQLLADGRSPIIQLAESIALTHHERWDGTGYPRGLKGEEIPIEGRIVALADTVDALTHDRLHQAARTLAEAVAEVERQSGKQFDPQIVRAFLRLYQRGEVALQPPSVTATQF